MDSVSKRITSGRRIRHVRTAILAPSFGVLPHRLRTDLASATSLLGNLKPIRPEAIDAASDDRFNTIRHELSAHYLALRTPGSPAQRTPLEADVLTAFEARADTLSSSCSKEFTSQLGALNGALTGGEGGWRTGFVKLSDDRAGNQIYFPPVSAVPAQIERMRQFLAAQGVDPPLFTAAVACALLLNCHPFTDGNGRTARVLFNHLLHRGGMPAGVYVPLYEIARRSHGGYEIALRIAELNGNWAPFLQWLLDALCCCRDLADSTHSSARAAAPSRSHRAATNICR